MKSINKQGSKVNLKKRTNSSMKLGRPLTTRSGAQTINMLCKSTTMRYTPIRQKSINNYMIFPQRSSRNIKNVNNNQLKKQSNKINSNNNIYQQFLMKNSDKMKLLYWNDADDIKQLSKIVVSADYIINQDNFWDGNTKVDEEKNIQFYKTKDTQNNNSYLIKYWKILHKNNYIIWVIRRKNSLKKIQELITNNSLPLHAIFYIKRKKNYTVDYSPILRQILKEKAKILQCVNQNIYPNEINLQNKDKYETLNIFEIIKTNIKDSINFDSFFGRVPVILQNSSKVYFLRVQSQPPGLQYIIRFLQKNPVQNKQLKTIRYKNLIARSRPLEIFFLPIIQNFILDYVIKKHQKQLDIQVDQDFENNQDEQFNQEKIETKLSIMKKSLIDYFIQQYGRNYQFEGGSSIYNFVGQMFKRNYKILYESLILETQIQKRRPHKIKKGWNLDQISLNIKIQYLQIS